MSEDMAWRPGRCHCGDVRFAVECPGQVDVEECNCSICARTGYLHLIVPKRRFKLLAGRQSLTSYRFNTRVAEHLFCRTCGVKSFYIPRSNPDGISVNLRCLDDGAGVTARVIPFDGRNWEQNAAALADKSR